MKPILILAKKELRDLFATPVAYVFITVFLFLSFWLYFSSFFIQGEASLRNFFSWLPILFIIFLPSITMGRWSEEKKSGTIEILFTLPLRDYQILLGKFLACALFLLIVLFLTLPLPFVVSRLGDLDVGQVTASYAGAFLLGLSYLAFGLFVSSLTKNQIIAFLLSVIALFLFYILAEPVITAYLPKSLAVLFQFFSFNQHFSSMSRGVIDSRDLIYFLSTVVLFGYMNLVSLSFRRA